VRPSSLIVRRQLTAIAILIVVLAAAAPAEGAVSLREIGSFSSPVHVAAPPGDFSRLFVVEQEGTVRVVRGGTVLPRPFIDLTGAVQSGGERGLLSIAFPPNYAGSGFFYVYFTDDEGDIRIQEYRRSSGSADVADPSSGRPVLEIPHRVFSNHNGGQLQFDPDGHLYAGTGDGGGANDPFDNAQNLGSLLGKLLRISPRPAGGSAYGIPSGNPFVGRPGARPEIYSFGLRNPFRFSFDRTTGDLAIGDVGQDAIEEVDYARRGGARGANYGWPQLEGNRPNKPGPPPPGAVPPVLELSQSDGYCSVIGGHVVRDRGLPSLLGRYVYGDLCVSALRSAVLRTPRATGDGAFGPAVETLASFGEDAAGCVYAVSLLGAVYQLTEGPREVPCRDRFAPRLTATVAKRQRPLRRRRGRRARRGFVARAQCDERCSITASGYVRIGRRKVRLRGAKASWALGGPVELRLKLTRRGVGRVRRALRRRRRVRARIVLRARDTAGNQSRRVKRVVKVLR
jgi:glucose/arabinose dehydrogenase